MRIHRSIVAAGAAGALAVSSVHAQEHVVASLAWTNGSTAGPNGTTYAPPDENRTIWIGEDFVISQPVTLTQFRSYGTIYPSPLVLRDLTVQIWDAQPPDPNAHLLLSSRPGSGAYHGSGPGGYMTADFDNAQLPAGSYWVLWSVATNTGQIAIFWAQSGPHTVGGGLPDNGIQWNPGGGWGWTNNWHVIYGQLGGGGVNGCNFTLYGTTAACYANCDSSTTPPILNVSDFLCFQQHFAAGEPYANCDGSTMPPVLNVSDFLCFMAAFAGGCP